MLTALGNPVADGQVALLSNGAVVATSLVDATGAYGFVVASPGTFDLRAAAPDADFEPVSGLAVNPGDSPNVDFVAGDATLQVTVTDNIQPVTGALVMLFLQQGGEVVPAGFAELEAGAVVTFSNLLPGNYKIDVTNSCHPRGHAPQSVCSPATTLRRQLNFSNNLSYQARSLTAQRSQLEMRPSRSTRLPTTVSSL